MQNTRLGISVGMMGAGLYLAGLVGLTPLVLLAGYVLLFESNPWLRKSAVKAVLLFLAFALFGTLLAMGNNVFDFLNGIIIWGDGDFRFGYPPGLEDMARAALDFVKALLYIILAAGSFRQGGIRVPGVDSTINKHM